MRRAPTALVAVVALASILVLGLGPLASGAWAQSAASISAIGWWSQRPGAEPLPKGGFEVALLPNAPQSQAALRIDVSTVPLASALLELTESQQVLGDVANIQACPTNDAWKPANPGAWADAPAGSCDAASVPLGRNANGKWTGDISSLLRAGTGSIVLAPLLAVSDAEQSAAFQIAFSGARLNAQARASGEAPEAPPGAGADLPDVAPPVSSFAPGIPAGLVALPSGEIAAAPTAEPESTPQIDAPAALPEDVDDADTRPWSRLWYFVPLSLVAGLAAVVVRRVLQQRGVVGG